MPIEMVGQLSVHSRFQIGVIINLEDSYLALWCLKPAKKTVPVAYSVVVLINFFNQAANVVW